MHSHEKMLGILDLFDGGEGSVALTFEQLHERLGYTRSTLYRYLKTLTDAGLLSSFPSLGYVLGPRIIELDYKIRTGDVLIRTARPMMEELARQFTGIALLCRRYRFEVICVHQESRTDTIHSNYDRGRVRSLLHGAASVAVLADLPGHQLRRLYERDQAAFAAAGFGSSLAEVKAALKQHRQRGWVMTTGEVTPGVTGIAAPIFDGRDDVLGSLSITVKQSQASPERVQAIADRVVFCATVISKTMARA